MVVLLKPFLNRFWFVVGCIIRLKEATAIMEYLFHERMDVVRNNAYVRCYVSKLHPHGWQGPKFPYRKNNNTASTDLLSSHSVSRCSPGKQRTCTQPSTCAHCGFFWQWIGLSLAPWLCAVPYRQQIMMHCIFWHLFIFWHQHNKAKNRLSLNLFFLILLSLFGTSYMMAFSLCLWDYYLIVGIKSNNLRI